MRAHWLTRIAVALFPVLIWTAALAQTRAAGPGSASAGTNQWRERANTLTTQLLDHLGELTSADQVLLKAQLCRAWWTMDAERARPWCEAATATACSLTRAPQNETTESRSARFRAFSSSAGVVAPVAKEYSDPIVAAVVASGVDQREHLAGALGAAAGALAMDHADPERAAELSMAAMKLGADGDVGQVASALNFMRRPELAERVTTEALAWIRRKNYDAGHVSNLINTLAFTSTRRSSEAKVYLEPLRQDALAMMLAAVEHAAASAEDQRKSCQYVPTMMSFLDQFPPEQAAKIRTAAAACATNAGDAWNGEALATDAAKPSTSAEYLRLADAQSSPLTRGALKYHAATVASGIEKAPVRALEICDAMSPEERKAVPTGWERARGMLAPGAVFALADQHEYEVAVRIIESSPEAERPFLRINLASRLVRPEDAALAHRLFAQVQHELADHDPDTERPYVMLLNAYARVFPRELPQVLKPAVLGMEHALYPCPPREGGGCPLPTWWDLRPMQLPAALLDCDPAEVDRAGNGFHDPKAHASFRLSLLTFALQRATPPRPMP